MIKINQIKLPVTHSDEALKKKIIKILKLNAKTGFTYRILKKSLDARKKPELFYTYSVAVELEDAKNSEAAIVKRAASSSVLIYKEKEYRIPAAAIYRLTGDLYCRGRTCRAVLCIYIGRGRFSPDSYRAGKPGRKKNLRCTKILGERHT